MRFLQRRIKRVLEAPFIARNYISLWNIVRLTKNPIRICCRYIFNSGDYPFTVISYTPMGPLSLELYSFHDMRTFNEIFCRGDYPCQASDQVIVDFGSNIGISAAYFLSRSSQAIAYLFEPLPSNVSRLHRNLKRFKGRYLLSEIAVGLEDAEVDFGWEETGRYGGVGLRIGNSIKVRSFDSNRILTDIIARHGRIDILKIDIESLEQDVTERIPSVLVKRIGKIFVEYPIIINPFEETHRMARRYWFRQFFPHSVQQNSFLVDGLGCFDWSRHGG